MNLLHCVLRRTCGRWLRASFLAMVLLASGIAAVAAERRSGPTWPGAGEAAIVRDAMAVRVLTGDEEWQAPLPGFLSVEPGSGTRNIVLPPAGASGLATGGVAMVRFNMPAGVRVMIREASGGLLGMVQGGDAPSVHWASLRTMGDRWDVRVSTAQVVRADDALLSWVGAEPGAGAGGAVRPAHERTRGHAIQFETDAPAIAVHAAGERTRLRVVANGALVADVDVPGRFAATTGIGIALGDPGRRRVELFVDEADLRSVEVSDARFGLLPWSATESRPRMVVLGDGSTDLATRSYAWIAATRLDYECRLLEWGDGGSVLGARSGELPDERVAADLALADAELIVVCGRIMDVADERDDHAASVGRWLESIARSARPDAVRIVLAPFTTDSRDRRARAIERVARQREFLFINLQGAIPAGAAGASLVAPSGDRPSEAGHEVLGTRLAEEIRKLDIDARLRFALTKRAP